MKCAKTKKLLSEYIDGELDIQTKKLVLGHLCNCADCSHELEGFNKLSDMLGFLKPEQQPLESIEPSIVKLHEYINQYATLNHNVAMPGSKKSPVSLIIVSLLFVTAVAGFVVYKTQPKPISSCANLIPDIDKNTYLSRNINTISMKSYNRETQVSHNSIIGNIGNDKIHFGYNEVLVPSAPVINPYINSPVPPEIGQVFDSVLMITRRANDNPNVASIDNNLPYCFYNSIHSDGNLSPEYASAGSDGNDVFNSFSSIEAMASKISDIARSNEVGGKVSVVSEDVSCPYMVVEVPKDKYMVFVSKLNSVGDININAKNSGSLTSSIPYSNKKNIVLRINLSVVK